MGIRERQNVLSDGWQQDGVRMSTRIVARTGTWLRRRSRWVALILAAFLCSYLIISQDVLSGLSSDSHVAPQQQLQQAQQAPVDDSKHPKDVSTSQSFADLLSPPRSSKGVCKQERPAETKRDYDLHDLFSTIVARSSSKSSATNGRDRPAAQGKLKVFVLPFTHVDPGWLMTFDEYSEDTKKILDNMHPFMKKNPKMRFMWAEFVFFERWWKEQSEEVKKDVRELVSSGRLEFASGSWVMTDEANAYFPVSVDNIVEGHQFIQREFGVLPTVVWSNDPFGYSNSVPYLFTQAGMNRTVINRIHHTIKGHLQSQRAIPFKWKQYFGDSSMLTQVLPYTHYDILNSCGPNQGSCCQFDFRRITKWSCPGPKPVPITAQNVKEKADLLVSQLRQMASMYEAPVMLMMHGDDFRFNNEEEWPQQHDNFLPLFEEINKGDKVEISFGTFSNYFDALEGWYAKEKVQPPSVTGDFFPYMCALGDYWTGYYTTRPFYKKQSRQTHNLIRAADLLSAEAKTPSAFEKLTKARRILSLFQHHDAITGTSKIHVMKDYSKQLFEAGNLAKSVIEESLKTLQKGEMKMIEYAVKLEEPIEKTLLNVQKGVPIRVSIYNSLPYIRHTVVSLLVTSETCSVVDSEGKEIEAQIEPTLINERWRTEGVLLSFRVFIPPLSSRIYTVNQNDTPSKTIIALLSTTKEYAEKVKEQLPKFFSINTISSPTITLSNGQLTVTHDTASGMMTSAASSVVGELPLQLGVQQMQAAGGAYILRSHGTAKKVTVSSVLFVAGKVQSTAYSLSGNVQHWTSVRDLPGALADQVHVGIRVDITKERNTEMVWLLDSSAAGAPGAAHFYTDSVGLQMLRRESYSTLTAPSNYYPMPTAAILEDEKKRITVVTDVEHGVMKTGAMGLEVMIDRMLNQDDGKGLGQDQDSYPTDLLPVQMHFNVVLEKRAAAPQTTHHTYHSVAGTLALQDILYPALPLVAGKDATALSTVTKAFPCDLQLLTSRLIEPKKMLITIFRNGVDCTVDSKVSCSDAKITDAIRSLLKRFGARSKITKTLLNGIQKIQEFSIDSLDESIIPEPQQFTTLVFEV